MTAARATVVAIIGILAVAVAVVAVVLATLTPRGPTATPSGGPSGAAPGVPLGQTVSWGITVDPAAPIAQTIAADEALVGRHVDVVNAFIAWGLRPASQQSVIDNLRKVSDPSRTIMITWEPGGRTDGQGGIASSVTLAEIASGSQDAAVSRFLTQLKSFQGPVVIRFAHEMNGSWYSWAGDPTTFKTAWAHIHSKVAELAPNVKMAWSVNNVDVPSSNTLEAYWPGASQVDYVGLDGYNCLRGWESPSVVFGQVYSRIAALDPAVPIWITETGSCEATPAVANSGGESKAAWITSLLGSTSFPRVSALVWFDRNKEFDWRVNSSAAAAAALKSGLAP